ncbi:DUF2752 domain-containing protein [Elizabethkingia anophelis]|uniref:Protein of uncharacterized function (DUF2752) n=1 Tax=Elizabethkingia anophelis TaxID=1117645 RepID=A0A7Z7LVK7_9FLAO|nr:DUF2752 domain-containing protein [Elizabethkingia anophelis]AVF47599.1 hypothetical protein AL491_05645 [Elizabethkingia anophelis]AVF51592.1 hypothetical protein AL492_08055 [Elizabethkingia anophelis]EJC8059407.1 DUF2752 domain-containing protein [Elizabethkingia anophelis]MBG0505126.1 DUF2752 domain-containing protein [Elizabethkingia anophelis]MCL1641864.1 DUF2752 domain-containing protein [Elizabethkingia anophelis]
MEIIKKYKFLSVVVLLLLCGGAVYIFYRYNPETSGFFLQCPFKLLTGYDCPGCGSQRALHALLHGEIKQSFAYNPLFIIAIPYVILGFIFNQDKVKAKYPGFRKVLFGQKAIYMILFIVIAFWLLRNL